MTIEIPAVYRRGRKRWESPDGRYYFDREAADRVVRFFEGVLKHHIGEHAGNAFVLRDDQRELLIRPLFGWKRTRDDQRRFRKLFAFCPKGYGKSPLGAGIGLYAATSDNEPAAEVYAVAADRQQARIVFDNSKIMVELSAMLSDGCEVLRDSISWQGSRSVYRVLSSDAATKHGFRPHVVVFDELHAQKSRDLYEALKKSMVKRRQPMMVIITHAGVDDESICFEEYEYAKRVFDGSIEDEQTLPVIFEAQPNDDWTDPAVWKRVNPGVGNTVTLDGLEAECAEAKAEPRKRNDFLRYHLNRWVAQAEAWIPIDWWDQGQEAFGDERLMGLECCSGLDLAQKWDLTAYVVAFRRMIDAPDDGLTVTDRDEDSGEAVSRMVPLNFEVYLVPFFWIPEETMLEHEREDGVPYTLWAEAGLVTPTEGKTIDYGRVYDDITKKIVPRFPLLRQGLHGYDPAFATDIEQQLRGRAGLKTHEVLQNYTHLSEAAQVFEALCKAGRIHHTGHRVLRNHVENMAIKRDDAGRIRPVKPRKQTKHIDGGVATLMALRGLIRMPPRPKTVGVFVA